MRVFRQSRLGDWSGVLAEIAGALARGPWRSEAAEGRDPGEAAAEPLNRDVSRGKPVDDAARLIDEINAAVTANELDRAAVLAEAALRAGARHPMLMRLVAEDLERKGEGIKAVAFLRRGLVLVPGDPTLMIALAARLSNLGRASEALRLFDEAAKTREFAAEAHFGMGRTLSGHGGVELAQKHFERALEIEPQYTHARSALALLLARIGETAAGRAQAERALSEAPDDPTATIALAVAEISDRKFTDAEERLRPLLAGELPTPSERAAALGVLADALNGQKRVPEAFEIYTNSNEANRVKFADTYAESARSLVERIAMLTSEFKQEDRARWRGTPLASGEMPPDVRGHAFLIGFPRSGTTLLENVLAAHKDVVALEERTTLAKAEGEYLHAPGGLARLAAIGPDEAAKFRRDYWRIVCQFVKPEGAYFVDKMPLTAISLPVVAKLFPEAKILFARRDPRDVVLSCFRRAFMPNPATYNLLTLKGSAELYDQVMRLMDLYEAKLPLALREVRYERFVADFEAEARAVCAFLGLAWDEGVNDFAAKAAQRTVTTPSAVQVRRGIYREGEGQWRPYAEQLAPVLPILEPWIAPKGYPVG